MSAMDVKKWDEKIKALVQDARKLNAELGRMQNAFLQMKENAIRVDGALRLALQEYAEVAGHSHPLVTPPQGPQPEPKKADDKGEGKPSPKSPKKGK